MKEKLIFAAIDLMLRSLTPELLRKFADMTLDFFENFVKGTKSEIDDELVLPACNLLRETFNIDD